jgi:1,4-dihydroxy-2-naphthoate octaprenyltransferase
VWFTDRRPLLLKSVKVSSNQASSATSFILSLTSAILIAVVAAAVVDDVATAADGNDDDDDDDDDDSGGGSSFLTGEEVDNESIMSSMTLYSGLVLVLSMVSRVFNNSSPLCGTALLHMEVEALYTVVGDR